MKFSQLNIGDRFLVKGVEYTKTGPLQAIGTTCGTEKMFMRAAVIELPPSQDKQPHTNEKDKTLVIQNIESALVTYHQTSMHYLEGSENEPKRERLDELFTGIKQSIGELSR